MAITLCYDSNMEVDEMAFLVLRDGDVNPRGRWVPPVDIYETEERDLVITA